MANRAKVLFLHGLNSSPRSLKADRLRGMGYQVCAPMLDNDCFATALQQAQAAFDSFDPELIVGSSRGGAVAMNLECREVPRILLAPAYLHYGSANTCSSRDVIVQGLADPFVWFPCSWWLASKSNAKLIEVMDGHRLNGKGGRQGLIEALGIIGYGCGA